MSYKVPSISQEPKFKMTEDTFPIYRIQTFKNNKIENQTPSYWTELFALYIFSKKKNK